ncbi:MAG: Zn-dependent oligopeptidase [Candidatus Eremiobacteraeota bacterium]|nr:Zn-dependent oligopeptidase [Candidatus Eremiobacteraeota bacterium]
MVEARCEREIGIARRRIDRIVRTPGRRTAQSFLIPLEDAEADLNDRLVAERFLFYVSTSKPVRDASQGCENEITSFLSETGARPDVFRGLKEVQAGRTATSPYQQKLLQIRLNAALRDGAGLDASGRRTFVALAQELTPLELEFEANLADERATIEIRPNQTAGLPRDFVATLERKPGGTLVVPVEEATSGLFLSEARDPAARKAFFVAFERRGGKENVRLLERALAIRFQLAHLLHYPSWAAYQLDDKMARTPARVLSFLDDLESKLKVGAREHVAELAALKGAPVQPWDVAYYDRILYKSRYDVDEEAIRQYFPAQHTIDAALALYAKILNIRFERGADDGWVKAPAVLHYRVFDGATGSFIGDTYFDLYPRPDKYGHFANWDLLPARVVQPGRHRAPLSVIVGNWNPPSAGKPSLLSHEEVETFFHEFGHNLASLLATAPYETLSTAIRHDFVEAPSQMFENWTWEPSILREITRKWDTGEPMPENLIGKLVASRYVGSGYSYAEQTFHSLVDMQYHMAPAPRVDTTAVWASTQNKSMPLRFVAGTYPQASIGHFMGGYDAGIYGYLWARVYAQDMFSRFQRDGLESAEAGKAYRELILEPAATYEPDVEVERFLGRPMMPKAFYDALGISAGKTGS